MTLRIDPGAHVEDDAAPAFLIVARWLANCMPSCVLPMPLAPTTTVKRAGNQAAAETAVQALDAGRQADFAIH